MGRGVKPASNSSIEIAFSYRGVRCRERIKLPPTPKNLKYCDRLKARIEDEIARNAFNYAEHFPNSPKALLLSPQPGAAIKLERYLDRWLKDCKDEVKSSTWNGYKKIVNNQLIPNFGHLALTVIRRRHVKEWARSKDISAKTIGNIISPLRIALDEAVDDELIDINPLAGWKIKRKNSGVKTDPIDPFSHEERAAILASLAGQNRNMVQFMFWTGLRLSEVIALNWADVDFVRGYVRISKALTQAADEPEEPKTAAGLRDVKLLPEAIDALQGQKEHTHLKGVEIFQNPRTGERWTGDQAIRKTMWQHALKRAGVRYRYPYQCRHTYATMMLMAGEMPQWVAKQMGHTDWAFTVRTYSRWIDADAPDAGMKANEQWKKNVKPAS